MSMPLGAAHIDPWSAAAMIACVVLCSTAGEVLTAAAMKSLGDLDEIRAHLVSKAQFAPCSPARSFLGA